ncbi:BnaA06g22850D [Brassica napus]|uniref:BnaA06g22850D protein n=1 Tax=Brassica napus TaxID=3708 RepID=A0A078HUQ2_BRANA|nr:BnaA06g22850D [Brassica napus]
MEPLNVECDLQSLRRLYSLLLLQSNANKEYVPQAFLLDENSQFLLKRLLDSATEELLARQHKVLAQALLGLPEKVSTPGTKTNSVSRGIVKLPSKAALTHEVVDSIERIETQLSAFQFCSSRGDRTRSCKSPGGVTPTEEEGYSSSVMTFQRLNEKALMEARQSYLRSRQMRHTTRTSSVAPSLRSVTNNATIWLFSHTLLMMIRLFLPRIDTGTSSESEQQVYSTEQESDEAYGGETVSTSGSSWETHAESVTESDSSYPSESEGDDENPQVSDSPPHNRSRGLAKQRKNGAGRLKRFKDKLGKVFHHHHYHHHEHHNKEEEQGRKPSAWKHLVKKHLHKDKEKLTERRMKSESKGLTTHNNKGGQFHALVKGFMRHHRRHSKNRNKKLQTPKRQGGVKLPKRGRAKSEKTNYLCNKDQEHDEN